MNVTSPLLLYALDIIPNRDWKLGQLARAIRVWRENFCLSFTTLFGQIVNCANRKTNELV